MSYLIAFHWGWVFGALVLGVIIGAATWQRVRERWTDKVVHLVLVVLVIGIALAALKLVPGRPGYWLDLALLMIAFYGFGCVFGWLLRDLAEPSLASGGWPAIPPLPPLPPDQVRPPYLSKPGRVPWAVVIAGPEAVADWEARRPAPAVGGTAAGTAAAAVARPSDAPPPSSAPVPKQDMPFAASVPVLAKTPEPSSIASPNVAPMGAGGFNAGGPNSGGLSPVGPNAGGPSAVGPSAGEPSAGGPSAGGPIAGGLGAGGPSASGPSPSGPSAVASAASSTAGLAAAATAEDVTEPAASGATYPGSASPPPSDPAVALSPAVGPGPGPAAAETTPVPSVSGPVSLSGSQNGPVSGPASTVSAGASPNDEGASMSAAPAAIGGAAPTGSSEVSTEAHPPAPVPVPHDAHDELPSSVMAPTDSGPPEPAPSPPVPDQDKHGGTRPGGLVAARGGVADDLKRVKGIGPQNEGRLHGLGIWHFAQIAAWTPDNVHWVGSYLAFPGRIDREKWIEQAVVLAGGGAGAKDRPAGAPRPRR